MDPQPVDENGLVILPFVGCETSPFVYQQPHTNTQGQKKINPKPLPSPAEKQKENEIINQVKMSLGAGPSRCYKPPTSSCQLPQHPQQLPPPPQFAPFLQQQTTATRIDPAQLQSHLPPQMIINGLLQTIAKMLPPVPPGHFYVVDLDKRQPELKQLPPHYHPHWGCGKLPMIMFTPPPTPKMEARPAVSLPVPTTPTGLPPPYMPLTPPTPVSKPPSGTLAEALSRLQNPPAQPQAVSTPSPVGVVKRSASEIENGTVFQEPRSEFNSADPAPKRRKPSKKEIPVIQLD